MTKDQPAQIDCRRPDCKHNAGAGKCANISPALTIINNNVTCWSYASKSGLKVF